MNHYLERLRPLQHHLSHHIFILRKQLCADPNPKPNKKIKNDQKQSEATFVGMISFSTNSSNRKVFWWCECRSIQRNHLGDPLISLLVGSRFVLLLFKNSMIASLKLFQIFLISWSSCSFMECNCSFVVHDFILVTNKNQIRMLH